MNNHRNVEKSYKGFDLGLGLYLSNQLDTVFRHYIVAQSKAVLFLEVSPNEEDRSFQGLQYVKRKYENTTKIAIFYDSDQMGTVERVLNKLPSAINKKTYDVTLDFLRVLKHLTSFCFSFSHRKGKKSKQLTGSNIDMHADYNFNDLITLR